MHPHLLKLIKNGEDECLDYKQEISSASKIAKSMSAFSNHKGGVLLIGVKDNRRVCGVKSEDEKYMLDLAARFYCKPVVELQIKEWDVGGKIVLECKIPKGKDRPYYAKGDDGKWWVYVRTKDKSLLASKIVVDVLRRQNSDQAIKITFTWVEKELLEYLENNERITLKKFRKMVNISHRRASKIVVNLISLNIIRSHTTEKEAYFTIV